MRRNAAGTMKVRQAWRALLALTLGLGAMAGLYLLARRHERQEVHWATRRAAESFRADLMHDVELEIAGLVRLAMLADRISSAEPLKENAELFIRRRPGCIAIEVLTPTYQKRSITYAPAEQRRNTPLAFGGLPVDLLKSAAESASPVVSASVAVDDRNTQRVTVAPVGVGGQPSVLVVAFFDVKERFHDMLADVKDLGFSMTILERGREQYRMVRDSKENEAQPRSTETAEVILPGVIWELRVWPQAATLYAMDAKLPELALIVGALISFLLASTVHFAYSARAQARNLRQLNVGLMEEIRHREQAEEELRLAHEELEARVQQRTTELSVANMKLEREVGEHARAAESLQKLTGQLFQSQDQERRRLARELHDGATQNLVALAMNMASMRKRALSAEQRTELLDDSVRLIQQSVGELRTTSHLLHPPLIDELGLPVTLRSYVDGFSARSGIRVALVLDPQLGRLNRDVELGIFRVVQESLANVHLHSHSDTANILLCREHAHIRLEISDEGTGIPPDVLTRTESGIAGVGIAGMRERIRLLGGSFEIHSGNAGTTIRILLPLMEAKPSDQLALRA